MSSHRLYYHVIWATKYRQRLISASIEAALIRMIQEKSAEMNSVVHAINMMPDHAHVAVSIDPAIAVRAWVKAVKGTSSRRINQMFPDEDEPFH